MRQALEEMYPIVEEVELDEAKYELYHKDFSSAMQHAYHVAKKHHGITIDPKEIDDKVATGPSKPSEGKTNKYRLKGDKGAVQIQVYNKGGSKPFELNMYKEEVDLDEGTKQVLAHGGKGQYKAVRDGDITKIMYKGKVVGTADFDSGADSFFASIKGEKGQRSFDDAQAMVDYFAKKKITEEVELDEKPADFIRLSFSSPADVKKAKKWMDQNLPGANQGFTGMDASGKDIEFEGVDDAEDLMAKLKKAGFKFKMDYREEVGLDEGGMKDLLIRAQELMGPSKNRKEGIQMVAKGLKVSEKEATKLVDAAIKMNEELAKIKGNTPADKGRKSAVEDDIERAEKKGDKKEVEKLKEVDLDEKEYKVTNDKLGVWTGTAHSEEDAKEKALKKWSVVGNVEFTKDTTVEIIEEEDLDEGKMSQLHQYIKDKKSAEEIAKLMKVDVATIKKLMSSYNVEDVEEGAAADARRAMKKDKDLKRKKDSADVDDFATDDDVKAASKNIMMQMRKAISLRGRFDVEFADGKKVKIPAKMAQLATKKYSEKKPADKEKFQARIGKSYKDMLSALKEELQPQKESILERMNRKIKENKNG